MARLCFPVQTHKPPYFGFSPENLLTRRYHNTQDGGLEREYGPLGVDALAHCGGKMRASAQAAGHGS
jgi:hypothetical protein